MRRFHYPAYFALAVVALTVGTVMAFGRINEPFLISPSPGEEARPNAASTAFRPGFAPATAEQYAAYGEEDRGWRDSSARSFSLAEIRARGDGRRSPRQAMEDRVFEHTQRGETGQAVRELERWVAANPRDEAAILSLARLLAKVGRTDASVERYRQLLALQGSRAR